MIKQHKRRSDDNDLDDTDDFDWSPAFACKKKFTGSNNGGAHNKYKKNLLKTYNNLQNSIDATFPEATHPRARAIFTHQNRLTYEQAIGFLESFIPIYDSMIKGGMNKRKAWSRVLVYAKSVFEELLLFVRSPLVFAMVRLWCGDLFKFPSSSQRNDWVKHPQVTLILALAAIQSDDQVVADLRSVGEIYSVGKRFEKLGKEDRLGEIQE